MGKPGASFEGSTQVRFAKAPSILFCTLFVIGFAATSTATLDNANADARVASGVDVPLKFDPETAEDKIAAVANKCLYQVTLSSFFPAAMSAISASGNTPPIGELGKFYGETSGDEFNWLESNEWSPAAAADLKFTEWLTPTSSAQRFINLNVTALTYADEHTVLTAKVSSDAQGAKLSVALTLSGILPTLRTEIKRSKSCSVSNWGFKECADDSACAPRVCFKSRVDKFRDEARDPKTIWRHGLCRLPIVRVGKIILLELGLKRFPVDHGDAKIGRFLNF